jgi:hypothetical protein
MSQEAVTVGKSQDDDPKNEKVWNMGNRNVTGPRSCETNMYVIWMEGVWRRGMLKVKVVVAMRMATGRSQGSGKQCGQ